jgi:hypothetical protein
MRANLIPLFCGALDCTVDDDMESLPGFLGVIGGHISNAVSLTGITRWKSDPFFN